MAQKPQLPEITKKELLEAISEGVARAMYQLMEDHPISFWQSIEDGAREAMKDVHARKQA